MEEGTEVFLQPPGCWLGMCYLETRQEDCSAAVLRWGPAAQEDSAAQSLGPRSMNGGRGEGVVPECAYVHACVPVHSVWGQGIESVRRRSLKSLKAGFFRGDFAGFSQTPSSHHSSVLHPSFAKDPTTNGG